MRQHCCDSTGSPALLSPKVGVRGEKQKAELTVFSDTVVANLCTEETRGKAQRCTRPVEAVVGKKAQHL